MACNKIKSDFQSLFKKNLLIYSLLLLKLVRGNDCINFERSFLSLELLEKLKKSSALLEPYQKIQPYLFWHQKCPTTGLLNTHEPLYPYIPHFFSLWELAPKKGDGIKIAILDTGIAAFEIEGYPSYIKHPDIEIASEYIDDVLNVSTNLRELNSLARLVQDFVLSTSDFNNLEKEISVWIREYCFYTSTTTLSCFLNNCRNLESPFDTIIYGITQGRRGIKPRGKTRFFTPVMLLSPLKREVIFEFLPIPTLPNNKSLAAFHGTHIYGLINAHADPISTMKNPENSTGCVGLAPAAQCIMIKTCKDDGTCDRETLVCALKKAQTYNPDAINLSLKIEGHISASSLNELNKLLNSFPYVIAASGNNFVDTEKKSIEAYPARCTSVEFDVGSFSYDGKNHYPISSFSQYEQGIGPKFVAPGFNIISTGIIDQKAGYLFLNGTSMAAALMSGFVALMLSEFKDDFSREQLLKVCYCSTLRMHNSQEWREKMLLGVLDMRTALFVLHVGRVLKKNVGKSLFEEKFNVYIKAIFTILNTLSQEWAKKYGINHDFIENNAEYISCSYNHNKRPKLYSYCKNISSACDYVVSILLFEWNKKKDSRRFTQSLMESIFSIVQKSDIDLFESLDIKSKERLLAAINKNAL